MRTSIRSHVGVVDKTHLDVGRDDLGQLRILNRTQDNNRLRNPRRSQRETLGSPENTKPKARDAGRCDGQRSGHETVPISVGFDHRAQPRGSRQAANRTSVRGQSSGIYLKPRLQMNPLSKAYSAAIMKLALKCQDC